MKSTWPLQPLAHICEFHRGLTYSKSNEIDFSDNIVLRANNIDLATNTLNFSELKYIEDSVVVPAAKKARKDSILICTASGSKSHLGKAAYIDDDYGYAFGGFMGQLTPNSSMNGRYLFHALTTPNYKDFIRKLSDGANINNLKFDDLKQFTIPVPPLPEQRRIVAILDQAFAAIATARAHTEQNLRNARELFESQLAAVFSQRGAGWVTKPLGELCEFQRGLTYSKSNEVDFSDNIVLRANNIDLATNTLNFSELKYIEDSVIVPVAKKVCKNSTIICTASGSKSHLGKAAYIDDDYGYAFGGFMGQLTPSSSIHGRYLFHALTTPDYKNFIQNLSDGANINNLKFDDLKQFTIPAPPLPEQHRIVEKLDAAKAQSQTLQSLAQRKLAALDELKQSLLQQAFSGQL